MKTLPPMIRPLFSAFAAAAIAISASSCGGGDESSSGDDPKPEAGGGGNGGSGEPAVTKVYTQAQAIKELQRVRQCGLALIVYATDNGGEFPPADKLAEVISANGDPSLLELEGVEEGKTLLYAEGMSDDSPGDLAIVASPVEMAGKRAVGFRDGSTRPLTAEQFAAEEEKLKAAGLELK